MSIISEIKELSELRKNQQIMSFYLLFVNALMLAISTKFYIALFTGDGLILKNYAISLLGLLILVPAIGKFAIDRPILTFRISVVLEAFSCLGYFLTSFSIFAELSLVTASFLVFASGLIMRPIYTQMDSIVTNGCKNYSLLKSKLDGLYTAIGAFVGAMFILLDIPTVAAISLLTITLGMARYYRNKVVNEIYSNESSENLLAPETKSPKTA
tara:strand:- start:451 stop:1089 length:639 start_codon:yes stop_codon:yes gene_type:complete